MNQRTRKQEPQTEAARKKSIGEQLSETRSYLLTGIGYALLGNSAALVLAATILGTSIKDSEITLLLMSSYAGFSLGLLYAALAFVFVGIRVFNQLVGIVLGAHFSDWFQEKLVAVSYLSAFVLLVISGFYFVDTNVGVIGQTLTYTKRQIIENMEHPKEPK
jgi:hypothetical protein